MTARQRQLIAKYNELTSQRQRLSQEISEAYQRLEELQRWLLAQRQRHADSGRNSDLARAYSDEIGQQEDEIRLRCRRLSDELDTLVMMQTRTEEEIRAIQGDFSQTRRSPDLFS
jgi:chromosome segregation ATPase